MPDFGVNTAILNTIDISCWSCKLNVGPLRNQVKSHHFNERRDARRQYVYFSYKFLAIIHTKQLKQPFWIMIWIYYFHFTGSRLDIDLDTSCWIRKIRKLCYKQY